MTYLVVDDAPTMRRIVINALAAVGFEKVHEAADGARALDLLKREKIDFVITDWNMPVMSGLELINAIRTNDKFKNLPVILVTTRGDKGDIVSALKAGVDNYVVKPFTPTTLKQKIDAVLKKRNFT